MKPLELNFLTLLLVSSIRAGEPTAPHDKPDRVYHRPLPPCPDQMVWTPNGVTKHSGECAPCPAGTVWQKAPGGRGECITGDPIPPPPPPPDPYPYNPYTPPPPPPPSPPPGPNGCRPGEIWLSTTGRCGLCPPGTTYRMLPNGQPACARSGSPPPSPPSACIPGQFDFLIGARLGGDVFTLAGGSSFYLSQLPLGYRIVVQGQSHGQLPRGTLVVEVSQERDCQKVIKVYCC